MHIWWENLSVNHQIKHELVIVISSIYISVIYALHAVHLIVKQKVLENKEMNHIGRDVFRRDQQLHAKQVNCTYHIPEI